MKRLLIWKLAVFSCAACALAAPAAGQPNQLVITGAVPNFDDAILAIVGSNFGSGEPTVTLDGAAMTVQSFTESEIVADLAPIAPGSYLLEVSRGAGASRRDDFVFTIGPDAAAGDVTAAFAGPGLAGGGDFGDLTLEIDEGYLDGLYARTDGSNGGPFARRDEPNDLTGDQRTDGSFIAERVVDEAPAVQGRSFSPAFGIGVLGEANGTDGIALYGRSYSTSGYTLGLHAVVHSPDGTAGVFHNEADGRLLSAGTPTYGEVMSLEANGQLNVRQLTASSDFVPGPGEQIFIVDGLATAPSGHTRAINGTTFSPDSIAVVGSAQPDTGGAGGVFDSYGVDGTGVQGIAQATTGFSNGAVGETNSPDGVGGWFRNNAGGRILLGSSDLGEVFHVEGDGTVRATAFTDLLGNPIGSDGVGVFEVETGSGLTGGPITGSGTIEVDFGALDSQYARLQTTNVFSDDNFFQGNVDVTAATAAGSSLVSIGNLTDGAIGLQSNVSGPGSRALVGFGDTGVQAGGVVGVSGFTHELDGVGVLAEATNSAGSSIALLAGSASPTGLSALLSSSGGRLLEGQALQAATGNPEAVLQVEADGSITQTTYGADLLVGNAYEPGTMTLNEVFRVASDGTVTATAVIETSAKRFKTNIASLTGALTTIQSLRGVSFDWKRDGLHDIGLVAEEVAQVLPEVVQTANGEVQGVNYGRLSAVLIEAVKEQQAQIERLEDLVEILVAER